MKRSVKLLMLLLVLGALATAAVFVTRSAGDEDTAAKPSADEGFALLDRSIGEIKYIKWETTKTEDTYAFENLGEIWNYMPDTGFTVDSDLMNSFASMFCPLTAYRKIEDVSDLSTFGLDHPACTFEITFIDESVYTINVGNITSIAGRCYISVGDGYVYTATSNLSSLSGNELSHFAAAADTATDSATDTATDSATE